MSRCLPHCCPGCRDEVCQECVTWKAESQRKDTCTAGPIPEISHDSDSDSNSDSSDKDISDAPSESSSMEEGDHILAADLLPPTASMDIRASSTNLSTFGGGLQGQLQSRIPSNPRIPKGVYIHLLQKVF